jgi:endoglucanase Acf2
MVWGDGGTYGTWWTANPEEIHGINFLPLNGGSLYLGRDPAYVTRNFRNMLASNRRFHEAGFAGDPGGIDRWHDVLYQYLAFADPQQAWARYEKSGRQRPSEFGETQVHTRQWLLAFDALGRFTPAITADHPTAAVFTKHATRTYVIFNARPEAQKVRFSDGVEHQAPPGLHAFSN